MSAHWAAGKESGDLVRGVVVHLRMTFNRELSDDDRQDLAQSAYCELLAKARRGERIARPLALVKRIAWRDARDLLRARREVPTDPNGERLGSLTESRPGPEERLLDRAELARALAALESLKPLELAAFRARFLDGLSAAEACTRIGRSERAYFGYLSGARRTLQERSGERFAPVERALLDAYVAGAGTAAERRTAKRLIDADPHAAAVARSLTRRSRRHRSGCHHLQSQPDTQTTGGIRCSKSQARS